MPRSRLAPPLVLVLLAVVLLTTGCTALEPRRRDPLPTKIAKGVVYVPACVVTAAGLVGAAMVRGAGERYAVDLANGDPGESRELYRFR